MRLTYPPDIISLKPNKTQGRYIALNCDPNQKLTMTSLFNWHHTYRTLSTIGSISSYKKILYALRPNYKKNIPFIKAALKFRPLLHCRIGGQLKMGDLVHVQHHSLIHHWICNQTFLFLVLLITNVKTYALIIQLSGLQNVHYH